MEAIVIAPQDLHRCILVKKDDLSKGILHLVSHLPFDDVPLSAINDLDHLHGFNGFASFDFKHDSKEPHKITTYKVSTTALMCFARSPVHVGRQPHCLPIPFRFQKQSLYLIGKKYKYSKVNRAIEWAAIVYWLLAFGIILWHWIFYVGYAWVGISIAINDRAHRREFMQLGGWGMREWDLR
jgi:hypothetical protein